jgi:hypothetical protein
MTGQEYDRSYTDEEVQVLTTTPQQCSRCGRMTALVTFTTYHVGSRTLHMRNPDGCCNSACPRLHVTT